MVNFHWLTAYKIDCLIKIWGQFNILVSPEHHLAGWTRFYQKHLV